MGQLFELIFPLLGQRSRAVLLPVHKENRPAPPGIAGSLAGIMLLHPAGQIGGITCIDRIITAEQHIGEVTLVLAFFACRSHDLQLGIEFEQIDKMRLFLIYQLLYNFFCLTFILLFHTAVEQNRIFFRPDRYIENAL